MVTVPAAPAVGPAFVAMEVTWTCAEALAGTGAVTTTPSRAVRRPRTGARHRHARLSRAAGWPEASARVSQGEICSAMLTPSVIACWEEERDATRRAAPDGIRPEILAL